jgi:hypothetical protein
MNSAENNLMRRTKSNFGKVIKFGMQNVGKSIKKKVIDACIDLTVYILCSLALLHIWNLRHFSIFPIFWS